MYYTSWTRDSAQFVGLVDSHRIQAVSTICRFGVSVCQFANPWRWPRSSLDQRYRKCSTSGWHKRQRGSINNVNCASGWWSGRGCKSRQIKKCPSVKISILPVSSGIGVSGLELRHASVWEEMVTSSSRIQARIPYLNPFTAGSHTV